MNEEHLHVYTQDAPEKPKENVLFGIVGAFLFALVGGILYYVLYQIGFLASISGLVCVICAIKGYSFFAKRESIRGIVISIKRELDIPVKFIGVGEKLDDMQEFDQKEFVSALFE